jgi:hypothetical protein
MVNAEVQKINNFTGEEQLKESKKPFQENEKQLCYAKETKSTPNGKQYVFQHLKGSAVQILEKDLINPNGKPYTGSCEGELLVLERKGDKYICYLADNPKHGFLTKHLVLGFTPSKYIVINGKILINMAKWFDFDIDDFFFRLDKDDGGKFAKPYVFLWGNVVVDYDFGHEMRYPIAESINKLLWSSRANRIV